MSISFNRQRFLDGCFKLLKFSIPNQPLNHDLLKAVGNETIEKLLELSIVKSKFLRDKGKSLFLSRSKLAVLLFSLSERKEDVVFSLTWKEFEEIVAAGLEKFSFETRKHFLFKWNHRKYEIDVLGKRRNVFLAIECKHWSVWRKSRLSSVKKGVSNFHFKVEQLKNYLEKDNPKPVNVFPVFVTSFEQVLKKYSGVSIVPIFKFNNFLLNFSKHRGELQFVD